MEGGGPGLGAAPQYEEQLLHTQVETSSMVFLNFFFILKLLKFMLCQIFQNK